MPSDFFPVTMHEPEPLDSNGMHPIVAFVSFLMSSSVCSVLSQCANTKPPFQSSF